MSINNNKDFARGMHMGKIGLVFAGGGGKGVYEIGVWKYLHEIGLDKKIKVISGTSVGALNAALFVASNYEASEKIWLNLKKDMILTPPTQGDYSEKIAKLIIKIIMSQNPGIDKKTILPLLGNVLLDLDNNFFTRDGMKELISKEINLSKLNKSKIECFATCFNASKYKTEYFQLNELNYKEIETILLASSAIPYVFPPERYKDNKYIDGGIPFIGDNIPIEPVYQAGAQNIIVIHLRRGESTQDISTKYPKARLFEIIPSEDLRGVLDFSKDSIKYQFNLGYKDAKRVLEPIVDKEALSKRNANVFLKEINTKSQLIKCINEEKSRIIVAGDLANELYRARIIVSLSAASLALLKLLFKRNMASGVLSATAIASIAKTVGIDSSVIIAISYLGDVSFILSVLQKYDIKVIKKDMTGNVTAIELSSK